ncbi:MAG: LD-carboxypeptidase [Desulfobacterales bacterium]|nr:LD-carboxypeptidase [Desulfobacterales bacterium]
MTENGVFGLFTSSSNLACYRDRDFLMSVGKNMQLVPDRLMPGDTIGVVAPAGPFDRKEFDNGVAILKAMGFHIVVPDDIHIKNGYLAGSDSHRADLINRFFIDRNIKAIICARGGFGSIRILSLLDFESIKKNLKIFIGFSDVSAILSVLYTKCGFVVFHGPMVTSLGDASRKTRKALFDAVSSDAGLAIKPKTGKTIRHGLASGPVMGGNLTTLCHLIGTPFEPVFKRHILFLEDKGEACYRIDRMLSHMKLAGCFDDLAGLVLGSFKDCGPVGKIIGVVDNIFKEYNIPVLAGFEVGHGKNNVTIPIGLNATLDTGRQLLLFHEPATSVEDRA